MGIVNMGGGGLGTGYSQDGDFPWFATKVEKTVSKILLPLQSEERPVVSQLARTPRLWKLFSENPPNHAKTQALDRPSGLSETHPVKNTILKTHPLGHPICFH